MSDCLLSDPGPRESPPKGFRFDHYIHKSLVLQLFFSPPRLALPMNPPPEIFTYIYYGILLGGNIRSSAALETPSAASVLRIPALRLLVKRNIFVIIVGERNKRLVTRNRQDALRSAHHPVSFLLFPFFLRNLIVSVPLRDFPAPFPLFPAFAQTRN